MLEMSRARKQHGDAVVVGGVNHLAIAHAAAGLDDEGNACLGGEFDIIGEGKERVGGEDAAARVMAMGSRFFNGDAYRIHTAHLPSADTDGGTVFDQHDGIGFDGFDDMPREKSVASRQSPVASFLFCHASPIIIFYQFFWRLATGD